MVGAECRHMKRARSEVSARDLEEFLVVVGIMLMLVTEI